MMCFYRNILFFEKRLDQDHRVALLRYEDWVRESERKLESLGNFLRLPDCRPWMTRYVNSGSARSKMTEALLPEVEDVCEGLMARFMKFNTAIERMAESREYAQLELPQAA